MATVKEIYKELDTLISRELSCSWDNDGLMICPDSSRQVKKVLLAIDATQRVCENAGNYDLIITHHPIIFKKLGSLQDEAPISGKAVKLIKAGTAVMSFHTRFDACDGGINDILAGKLGLKHVEKFGPFGEVPMGRVGDIKECDIKTFAKKVKKTLGTPMVLYTDTGKTVKRVAVCGGDGGSMIYAAQSAGADVLVTGRGGYNSDIDARDAGISVVEAGHYYTETIFGEYFEEFFKKNHPEVIVEKQTVGCEILSI